MSKYDEETNDAGNQGIDENQAYKVRFTEQKFRFKFEPWLYAFAMTLHEPAKAYAWFVQSKKYRVIWNHETRMMNFTGDMAKWGMENIKRYLGKEVFDHFGQIRFTVNRLGATDKQPKPQKNEAPDNIPYID